MILLKPRYSSFSGVIAAKDGFIILETYKPPQQDVPYLYKLDLQGNQVWERKHPCTEYHHFYKIFLRDGKIIVLDDSGEATVDPDSGQLLNMIMTR